MDNVEVNRSLTVRPATENDARSIFEIYNHYIGNTYITFETQLLDADQMAGRLRDTATLSLPWLVAEQNQEILGYAYAAPWKARAAYRHTVETTVYLAPDYFAMGVGRQLYARLLDDVRALSMHSAIGGIALPNDASIRLHEKLGFKKIGQFQEVGYKHDQWIDVGYWQLSL